MPRRIISVGASSKKAGKSKVASFLVSEFKPTCALKVSSGSHTRSAIVTDPELLGRPGTDTGALLAAGARKVLWVNASGNRLAAELEQALEMFPADCTLVIEGNSALEHIEPDFSIFVMTVPFVGFKPSAEQALAGADLVLVDMRWNLAGEQEDSIGRGLAERAPGARVIYYSDEQGFDSALERTAAMARRALS
jgi:hypothetical protein